MTNAELIKVLRYCGKSLGCDERCPLLGKPSGACFKMIRDAADALEAADKRIEELSLDCEMYQQKCMELDAKMQTVTDCHTLEEGEQHGES